MSRTHRELAVGSHLIAERQREGEKETKAEKQRDKEGVKIDQGAGDKGS